MFKIKRNFLINAVNLSLLMRGGEVFFKRNDCTVVTSLNTNKNNKIKQIIITKLSFVQQSTISILGTGNFSLIRFNSGQDEDVYDS